MFGFFKKKQVPEENFAAAERRRERASREAPSSADAPSSTDAPERGFEMMVDDVFTITGRGTVVTGQVRRGSVRMGDKLQILGKSGTYQTTVGGIEVFRRMLDTAQTGDNVGILLRGVDKTKVGKGDLLTRV